MFVLLEKYDAEEGAMPIKAFAEEGAMETALSSPLTREHETARE